MKKFLWTVLCSFFLAGTIRAELMPLNVGEVLLPENRNWELKALSPKGSIFWQFGPPGPLLLSTNDSKSVAKWQLRGKLNVDCDGFDQFIIYFNIQDTAPSKVDVILNTDDGVKRASVEYPAVSGRYSKTELVIGLDKAKKATGITVNISNQKPGRGSITWEFHYLALRNSGEFAAYLKHWERFRKLQWDRLLQPESYQGKFKPMCGVFFSEKQLNAYRKLFKDKVKNVSAVAPEQFINGSYKRPYLTKNPQEQKASMGSIYRDNLAFTGIIKKDKKLMRLAARYMLYLACLGTWSDFGEYDAVPGNSIGNSAFIPGLLTRKLAFMYDLAGEFLTKRGQQFVLKALQMKGVSLINYTVYTRFNRSFGSNQFFVMTSGRMPAQLIFEKYYTNARPYTEIAKAETDRGVNEVFTQNGGYGESLSYMWYMFTGLIPVYHSYSVARNVNIFDILPQNLKKSGNFAQLMYSTSRNPKRQVLSIGHSHSWNLHGHNLRTLSFLAAAIPGSIWVNLYKRIDRKLIESLFDANYSEGLGLQMWEFDAVAAKNPEGKLKNLTALPECGLVNSFRTEGDKITKVVLIGSGLHKGKPHQDSGSFILEYAGDIYAMDMPVYHGLYAASQWHNMLVPVLADGSFGDAIYWRKLTRNKDAKKAQMPSAKGNNKSFRAQVDITKGWDRDLFTKNVRKIDSPTPHSIKITDEYTLGAKARGAAFILLTYLPCKIAGNKVIITGEYSSICEITVPSGCHADIEKFNAGKNLNAGMALDANHQSSRIIIRKEGKPNAKDKIQINISFKDTKK